MKASTIFALWLWSVNALCAQVVYSVSTDKGVYDYRDSIHVTIRVVNNQDIPDTLFFSNGCQADYTIDTLDWMEEATIGCIQVFNTRIISPHDSTEWSASHFWDFFTGERLGPGRHGVVGILDDYRHPWISDTLWINVIGPTGVSDLAPVLHTYSLAGNYPNPFNPSTTIRFDLPRESHVRLAVFDVLGREVAALLDERRPAGSYALPFNAAELSSGIYFYRLQAGDFVATKQMLLMK